MTNQIAQYQLVKKLGEGVFGEVFLAKGVVRNRQMTVAIKRLHAHADEEARALLVQEYLLLKQIRHKCIVRVYEYIPQENAVVMEYVKGVELRDIIDTLNAKSEKIFVDTAVEMGCELADALFHAYTSLGKNGKPLHIVHRDIKPSNIIMTEAGGLKILDFGLARVHNEAYAPERSDAIKGTPIYMAPEQVLKQALDHRTDLFALGLILYELLMGKPAYHIPYDAKDPIATIFQDITEGRFNFDVEGLKKILPNIGPTIAKLLQHEPHKRFQNGQELWRALRTQLPQPEKHSYIAEFARYYFSQVSVNNNIFDGVMEQKQQKKSIIETLPPPQHAIHLQTSTNAPLKDYDSSFEKIQSGVHMTNKPKPPVGGAAFRSNKDVKSNNDGMLDFVPTAGSIDDDDASATQFFTISAPTQNTNPEKNTSLDANAGNFGQFGGHSMNQVMNSGNYSQNHFTHTPAMNSGGFSSHSYGGQSIGGIGPGGIGPGGIGPGGIGSTGVGISSGIVQPNLPPATNSTQVHAGEASMKSNRIWIILSVVFVLILMSVLAVLYISKNNAREPVETKQEIKPQPIKNTPVVEEDEPEEEEPEKKEVVVSKTKTVRTTKTQVENKAVSAPVSAGVGGTLTLNIQGEASKVTLEGCGKRQRKDVSGNKVFFNDVTTGVCTIKFAPSSVFTTIQGGQKTMTCTISGNSVICR